MVLGAQKDPALEAELAAITKIAASDTANPKVLEALPGQIQAALARSKGRETAAAVVSGLVQAQEAGKGAEAIADLRRRQMPEPAIQAAAAQAGVPYITTGAAAQRAYKWCATHSIRSTCWLSCCHSPRSKSASYSHTSRKRSPCSTSTKPLGH